MKFKKEYDSHIREITDYIRIILAYHNITEEELISELTKSKKK